MNAPDPREPTAEELAEQFHNQSPAERRRSEEAYMNFLARQKKGTQFQFPDAADLLPEEDVEDDDE